MKRIALILILIYCVTFTAIPSTKTGIFISVKNFESILDFSGEKYRIESARRSFSELFLKIVNISSGRIEFNLLINFIKGKAIESENGILNFSQIGIGAEFGKTINLFNVRLGSKMISCEFVPGVSGIISFNRKTEYIDELSHEDGDNRKIFYNFGFFSSLRLCLHLKRADTFLGFQASLPFYANDIPFTSGESLLRSSIFIGLAF